VTWLDDQRWQPGEHTRYAACRRHIAALSRMDFDDAVNHAITCQTNGGNCVVAHRPTTQEKNQ
jgi:hypothetical protein